MSAKPEVSYESLPVPPAEAPDILSPPGWAMELVEAGRRLRSYSCANGLEVSGYDREAFALASVRIPGATRLDASALQQRVTQAYNAIAEMIRPLAARHPVRLWNHIPAIHQRMDDRRDRYMVFNAGRYEAFAQWYGGAGAFDQNIATASGIGHTGQELVIHCLSANQPGLSVENPRQIAPHRYSERFGPLPPCFARATVLHEIGLVLVGGTASIFGEDSRHRASLPMQMGETLTNLATVVERAHALVRAASKRDESEWLRSYRDVRVYFPRAGDDDAIEAMVRPAFEASCRVEFRHADLCRAELLVEIEGVAQLERKP